MSKAAIGLLTSPEERRAKENLAKFIAESKRSDVINHPAAPSWEDPAWDLSDLTARSSAASLNATISWRPVGSPKTACPYPTAWADLGKALIVSKLRERFDTGEKYSNGFLRRLGTCVRKLIEAVKSTVTCITAVKKSEIEAFLSSIEFTSEYSIAKLFIKKLIGHGITPRLSGLVFKAPKRTHAVVGPSNTKPSTWDEMVALATSYQLLQADNGALRCRRDFHVLRYYSMLANLLACAPSRTSELWRIAADCAVITAPLEQLGSEIRSEEAEMLDFKFGLVWHPVKGGRPIIKPVPGAMQPIAHRCIEILRSYGDEARETARFIIDNPGVLPISKEHADVRASRETGTISQRQIKALLGVPEHIKLSTVRVWKDNFKKTRTTRIRTGGAASTTYQYCFKTMEEDWWNVFQARFKKGFGSDWPYVVNTETYKLRADNALLLIYSGTLDPDAVNFSKIFLDTPRAETFQKLLASVDRKYQSIWERLNIRLPNGAYPVIRTHQLRHFLNTMAQRAGLPEPIIAMWSGRTSIAQNATYDHLEDAERLRRHGYVVEDYDHAQAEDLLRRQVDQAFLGLVAPPSFEVLDEVEVGIKELQRRRIVSITQIGFCVGDLKEEPCPHAMSCLNCHRLVVCKGATKARGLIEAKIRSLEAQFRTIKRHLDEEGGIRIRNENVLPHLQEQIEGAKDLLLTLNDPYIPEGTIIARKDQKGPLTGSFSARIDAFVMERKALEEDRGEIKNG